MLLTTREVAALLKVHPKHVYRLLKRGLPAHRVGDEWRFDEEEVRAHCRGTREGDSARRDDARARDDAAAPPAATPPLLAANGDIVVEALLQRASEARRGPLLGHVAADHAGGLALLRQRAVLVAGGHGDGAPGELGDVSTARIHLVEREVGLVFRKGLRVAKVGAIAGRRLAVRPATAGVRGHLEAALRSAGVEPATVLAGARVCRSHRDVVLAVCRGEAEIGLATGAWARSAGLSFLPLASESYGLVVRVDDLADRGVVGLCEAAQEPAFRRHLARELGYGVRRTGELRLYAARATPRG